MSSEMTHDALAMVDYSDTIPVCVLGDSGEAVARMTAIAEALGRRIAWSGLAGDAAARKSMPDAPLLIELDGTPGEAVIDMLDWAYAQAERSGRRSLVAASAGLIDLFAARSWHPDIQWLIDASEDERTDAAEWSSRPAGTRLHDIGRDDGPPILQQLTEDVSRIAALLASLTDEEAGLLEVSKTEAGDAGDEHGIDAAHVRSIIRARRLRDQFFRGGLFADPAWDMLLDLMAARLEGARVAVSSLCIAAAVPPTTALRWIKTLTDRGLFVRSADPKDGRRVYISLSEDATRALAAYLKAAQRIAPNAI